MNVPNMKKTLALGLLMLSLTGASEALAQDAAPLTVGHRGASGTRPEHTFASYDEALRLNADYIEQDLQVTADGVLVVMHDGTLNRTVRGDAANCTGNVSSKTLAQIKTCDAGVWFGAEWAGQKVPTLEEVFQRYGKTVNYYIETKTPDPADHMEEKLLALIDKYDLREASVNDWQVLIQSFSADSLKIVHQLDPRLPLIFLGNPAISAMPAVREYAVGIGPSFSGVTQAFVDAAHALCLDVHPYTVNNNTDLARMLSYGVDGMFTNFPDRLNALLPEGGAPFSLAASKDAAGAMRRCRGQEIPVGAGTGGAVPATLSLTLGTPATFGAFVPGVAKDYTASTTASVISSAGDAALSYSDPGHLMNGAFALPAPLQVSLSKSSWDGPTSNESVTIDFKQPIGAGDALRTGAYTRTLTFTLSTTNP